MTARSKRSKDAHHYSRMLSCTDQRDLENDSRIFGMRIEVCYKNLKKIEQKSHRKKLYLNHHVLATYLKKTSLTY